MRKLICFLFLCSFLVADWADVTTIKDIMQSTDSWKNSYLAPMMDEYYHIMLTGHEYSSNSDGGSSNWLRNYSTFWPMYSNLAYADKSEDYLNYAITLSGIPDNWDDYPVTLKTGENIMRFDVFSDTVNRALARMDNNENGYGINQIEYSTTFQGVNQVSDKVSQEFHDAISNVDDNLFTLNFSSLGEFYVNVLGSMGVMVTNPWADFVYNVSLIPDETNNPMLYSLYTYWPLREYNQWRYVFRVVLYLFSFVFMLNKIKEVIGGGEWT